MFMDIYERVSALFPESLTKKLDQELKYLGVEIEDNRFLGFLILYGGALSIGIAINIWLIFKTDLLISFLGLFVFLVGGIYVWMNIASESKGKFVEKILPDALQLIASNVKAGLTTERALFVSARPEFGPLEIELKNASQKIMTGMRVEQALVEISEKIRSITLERTMWLISKGISSGGQIAELLVQLSDDLREQREVEEETKANISMYVMLILFSAAIGAPLLFGIASFIVEILAKQMGALPTMSPESMASTAQAFGRFRGIAGLLGDRGPMLTGEFIQLFSVVALIITSVFSSLTVGIINGGKEKNGVKYIPVLIIVTIVLFYVTRAFIGGIFSGLAGA